MDSAEYFSINRIAAESLMSLLYVHVDGFVLLSGYLGYEKKFSCTKVCRLWLQILFWSATLFFAVSLIWGNGINFKEMIKSLMPFTQQRYWFMTTYLLMYLLTPVLNAAIGGMDRNQYKMALILYLAVYVMLQNIIVWSEFTTVNPHSPLFFGFLYMMGAYLHKYPIKRKIHWFLIYVVSRCIEIVYKLVITAITLPRYGEPMGETLLSGYGSVLTVIGAVALLMTFANMQIKCNDKVSKLLVFASPLTLGVYLIHDNGSLREPLWALVNLPRFADKGYFIPMAWLASIVIFTICIALEWVRSKLFEIAHLDNLADKVGIKADKLFSRRAMSASK